MTKKLMALLLALVMVFAFCACGDDNAAAETTETTDAAVTSAATETEAAEADAAEGSAPAAETDAAEGSASADASYEEKRQNLLKVFTLAVQGQGDDGFDYYLLFNDDKTMACLMKADHDNQQCVDVTGDFTEDEEGWLTITDNTYGYSFSFQMVQDDNGNTTGIKTTNDVNVEMSGMDVETAVDDVLYYETSYTLVNPNE